MDQEVWESAFQPKEVSSQVTVEEEKIEDSLSSDFQVLLNLGRLTSTFSFGGHTYSIKTLKMNEELKASSLAGAYEDNLDKGTRAFIIAIAAAALESVDGSPIVSAFGPNDDSVIERKFNYILENFYWYVVEYIYDEYAKLSERVGLVVEEFKKK